MKPPVESFSVSNSRHGVHGSSHSSRIPAPQFHQAPQGGG
jgi:hypothetical protein